MRSTSTTLAEVRLPGGGDYGAARARDPRLRVRDLVEGYVR